MPCVLPTFLPCALDLLDPLDLSDPVGLFYLLGILVGLAASSESGQGGGGGVGGRITPRSLLTAFVRTLNLFGRSRYVPYVVPVSP